MKYISYIYSPIKENIPDDVVHPRVLILSNFIVMCETALIGCLVRCFYGESVVSGSILSFQEPQVPLKVIMSLVTLILLNIVLVSDLV